MYFFNFLILSTLLLQIKCQIGILYPRPSETRDVVSLNGLWNFATSNDTLQGFREQWYKKNLKDIGVNFELMPVPSSYNDLSATSSLRDHVGFVWYERTFFIPKAWDNSDRVWIRFGSVSVTAEVYINGEQATKHTTGHLPFAVEITKFLKFGEINKVTVACDNTLSKTTVPQGNVKTLETGRVTLTYQFDYFIYAGIDRPVFLYTTPNSFIDDVEIQTDVAASVGLIVYKVGIFSESNEIFTVKATLFDKNGNKVDEISDTNNQGHFQIENAYLWWPYLMNVNPGYLYSLKFELINSKGSLVDTYTQKVGIRKLEWDEKGFTLNKQPLYLRGIGRHEDSDFRGRGSDLSLIVRDHNLLKWVGANCYRSYYPYSEEDIELADELGLMVIQQTPSTATHDFSDELLENHKNALSEMINRDKNRPSIIMWSLASNVNATTTLSVPYFESLVEVVRERDISRPITMLDDTSPSSTHLGSLVDIISFSKYGGWFSDIGYLDVVTSSMDVINSWHETFKKPVLVLEYGADAVGGLSTLPSFVWSEQYQKNVMSNIFKAFDKYRSKGILIGEFIWCFADFATKQEITRVGGNRKGIFTRNRQPKGSAYLMRQRYWSLAHELNDVAIPEDLFDYISDSTVTHDEL